MDPFTDEEMLEVEDPEELVNDLILAKKTTAQEIESKRWTKSGVTPNHGLTLKKQC